MRYIDADELSSEMREAAMGKDNDPTKWVIGCWIRYKLFENVLAKIPTADVAPVVHAHWITRNRKERLYQCSHCGAGDSFPNDLEVNYCWNCGAKMDEEREEQSC